MTSSNLVATHNDIGAFFKMKTVYGNHIMTLQRSEPIVKLPHQIWIQYRSHARNIGIRIKLFKSVCTLIIMIEITDFFVEFFLDRMQEYIMVYLFVTLLMLWTSVQPNSPRGIQASVAVPRPTLYTYIFHVVYLIYIYIYIYIPWNSDVLQRFIKTIVFLVWCLIPKQVLPNQCLLRRLK